VLKVRYGSITWCTSVSRGSLAHPRNAAQIFRKRCGQIAAFLGYTERQIGRVQKRYNEQEQTSEEGRHKSETIYDTGSSSNHVLAARRYRNITLILDAKS
jgi:hypothetical protein